MNQAAKDFFAVLTWALGGFGLLYLIVTLHCHKCIYLLVPSTFLLLRWLPDLVYEVFFRPQPVYHQPA